MIIIRIPKNITYLKDNSVIEETVNIDDYETISMPYIEVSEVNDKLINKIIKVIRNSSEYREYILFLKQELNLDHCSFFTNLDIDDVSIEIHHGPMVIYDIVDIVLRKQLTENINVTIWDICEEVMRLHYENRVGLIPLSTLIHSLYHQGEIFIPYQCFYGDWKSFYNEYKKYFTTDQINALKNYISISNEVEKDKQIPDILKRNYHYLIVEGQEYPCKIELKQKKEED